MAVLEGKFLAFLKKNNEKLLERFPVLIIWGLYVFFFLLEPVSRLLGGSCVWWGAL